MEKTLNLTVLIGIMENNPDSYTELQIQEVKIQIKQIEALVVELKASIELSSTVLVSIRKEVKHNGYIVMLYIYYTVYMCWYVAVAESTIIFYFFKPGLFFLKFYKVCHVITAILMLVSYRSLP